MSRDRSHRWSVLLVGFLLLTTAVPLVPGASGQSLTFTHLSATVTLYHEGHPALWGNLSENNVVVNVTVSNTGQAAQDVNGNVSVHVYGIFTKDASYSFGKAGGSQYCLVIPGGIPAGQSRSVQLPTTIAWAVAQPQALHVHADVDGCGPQASSPPYTETSTNGQPDDANRWVPVGRMPDLTGTNAVACTGATTCSDTLHAGKGSVTFHVDVSNAPWASYQFPSSGQATDPNDNSTGVPYSVLFEVRSNLTNQVVLRTVTHLNGAHSGTVGFLGTVGSPSADAFSLDHRIGNYTLTVTVNANHSIADGNHSNDAVVSYFRVLAPDLVPDLGVNNSAIQPHTSSSDPYPDTEASTVDLNITVRNLGNDAYSGPVNWSVTLDPGRSGANGDRTLPTQTTSTTLAAGGSTQVQTSFKICPTASPGTGCYAAPGKHVIQVTLDPGNQVAESNDSNNVATLPIYIADTTAPTLDSSTVQNANGTTVADGGSVKAGEPLWFNATITEADLHLQDVVLHLTQPGGATRDVPMNETGHNGGTSQYAFSAAFPHGLANVGTYDYTITAVDPSGNAADPATGSLAVTGWPVNVAILHPLANATLRWNPNGTFLTVNASINGTGFEPTSNTDGKGIYWVDPDGVRTPDAGTTPLRANADQSSCGNPLATTDCQADHFYRSNVPLDTVGTYAITVVVQDKAGIYHNLTENISYEPYPPALINWSVPSNVDAGDSAHIAVNVTASHQTFPVNHTIVNLTHLPDGRWLNLTLPRQKGSAAGNGTYATDVTTGFGGQLPWAGTYRWVLAAQDTQGNWNSTNGTLLVRDTQDPSIEKAGVSPENQQVGADVTFYALASDDTNFTVNVTVSKDQQVVAQSNLTDPDGDGRYTTTMNFTQAGTYKWLILVRDSSGKTVVQNGTLDVAGNLPPRFVPTGVLVNSTDLILGPRPQIVFHLLDPDLVNTSSIALVVNGTDVTPNATIEPGSDTDDVTLSYTMDRTFAHGATFPVNLTARDDSAVQLSRSVTYTVHVDARPPTTEVPSFAPRYRSGGGVWNVSFHTLWTLQAADNVAGPSSGVAAIHWRLAREAVGTVQTYDGPFRLTANTPPGQLRDGLYTLTYWSVDAAGNQEAPRTMQVRLDLHGPDITYFPHGRYVNATATDPEGVQKMTLHYRLQGASAYGNVTMSLQDGLYRGVLPATSRGNALEYYVTATDQLGNVGQSGSPDNPWVYQPGNHPPQAAFTNPSDGATVSGTAVLRWTASDADGDQLTQSLQIKLASAKSFHELAPVGSSSRSFSWDTTSLADGAYDLRLVVSDQTDVTLATVHVVVANNDKVATPNAPNHPRVEAGHEVRFTAKVLKAASQVNLELYRDGKLVATVPMHDDGTGGDVTAGDGTYTAVHAFTQDGTYTWRVNVTYERPDGQVVSDHVAGDGNVQVYLTSGQVFQRNLGLWGAVVVLTAAVAGLGVYALRTRWR